MSVTFLTSTVRPWMLMLGCALVAAVNHSYAQFAVVNDPDGFVNVRREPRNSATVIDTLSNDHLVYCYEKSGNWMNIDYRRAPADRNGFVYADRLSIVDSLTRLGDKRNIGGATVLRLDSISIRVTTQPFVPGRHKLSYVPQGYLSKIDGHNVWGQDGAVPKLEYGEIFIAVGSRSVRAPQSALGGLYEPNPDNLKAFFNEACRVLYLTAMNGDGAGGYLVVWRFVDGEYTDRLLTHGF